MTQRGSSSGSYLRPHDARRAGHSAGRSAGLTTSVPSTNLVTVPVVGHPVEMVDRERLPRPRPGVGEGHNASGGLSRLMTATVGLGSHEVDAAYMIMPGRSARPSPWL